LKLLFMVDLGTLAGKSPDADASLSGGAPILFGGG
jgi:hypothetical protein